MIGWILFTVLVTAITMIWLGYGFVLGVYAALNFTRESIWYRIYAISIMTLIAFPMGVVVGFAEIRDEL